MIEVLVIALTIAGVSGWCLFLDERSKKNGSKRKSDGGRKKMASCARCANYRVRSEGNKKVFPAYAIEPKKIESGVKSKV